MKSTEFLKLIGAPWAAYHDHAAGPEAAADIAAIRPVGNKRPGYSDVVNVFGCAYPGEVGQVQRARRDLIAAAPELYAALAAIVDAYFEADGEIGGYLIQDAAAALAKARGETGEQS